MIRTAALTLAVQTRTLLRDLDWAAAAGECWLLIGRNGAGKSTLLRTLAGLAAPQAGQVLLDDRPLREWSLTERAQRCAYLPQSNTDSFGYRVLDTVLAARYAHAPAAYWDSAADHVAALDALDKLDVAALAMRDVRSLSGGERQRVAIAALLAQDTPLMLLDEPAAALDLAHQVSLMRLFAALAAEAGKAIVMVSHDPNLAARAATHALLLMGDGGWQAGDCATVLTADALAGCLGQPVDLVSHGGRRWFIPSEPR